MEIYLIAKIADGPCKIGISYNPKLRLNALQSAHYEPLRIFGSWKVHGDKARGIEAAVHYHFRGVRLMGEWFKLTVHDATAHLDQMDFTADYGFAPGSFNKTTYQAQLMRDRRLADSMGYGGSKETNPHYLTVKQFRSLITSGQPVRLSS